MALLTLPFVIALVLDAAIGDPPWIHHPVKAMGGLASRCERLFRRSHLSPGSAGMLSWIVVVGSTAVLSLLLLTVSHRFHPAAGMLVSSILLYFSIASRDLAVHALRVQRALERGDMGEARRRVSFLCSRDTGSLDEQGLLRATVESVAENLSDGIIAPLFFAALGGPAAAMIYKAVNTLDSMFGYKNEWYAEFGWFSAKADDLVNYFPARLSGLILCFSALLMRRTDAREALRMMIRDQGKAASPNAGYPEAAAAGALGIRLGGPSHYFGSMVDKPYLGEGTRPLRHEDIMGAVRLMWTATLLFTACAVALRYGLSMLP